MITAVAIVTAQDNGDVMPGVVGKLETDDGMELLMIVTNQQGYDVFKRVPVPFVGTLKLGGAAKYVEYPVSIPADAVNVTLRVGPSPSNPQDIPLRPGVAPFKQPYTPAPHAYTGNFCGTRVAGLPPVQGYSPNAPDLVMSWFYPFYDANFRAQIRASWKARGYVDQIASWPDCRARGFTPQIFVDSLKEWIADGIRPCVMLTSKDFDLSSDSPTGADVSQIIADLQPVIKLLVGLIPRVCVGWELNLWLSPQQVQELTDALMPPFVAANCKTYVHFFSYMSFPISGDNAVYWNANIGKLIGVLNERSPQRNPTSASYVDLIEDCLERFAGNDNMPSDNGIDGKPFDFIALEITASDQFAGNMTEAEGDTWGSAAVNAPPKHGPAGVVGCMGSGNGQ